MTLGLPLLTALALFMTALVVLNAGTLLALRDKSRRPDSEPAQDTAATDALLAEALARMEGLVARQDSAAHETLGQLREDMAALKADVEWLAGDRMIEQAIALAQSGSSPEDISGELGLSLDSARTIAMFRRH